MNPSACASSMRLTWWHAVILARPSSSWRSQRLVPTPRRTDWW
jgi:hypothetical protein